MITQEEGEGVLVEAEGRTVYRIECWRPNQEGLNR